MKDPRELVIRRISKVALLLAILFVLASSLVSHEAGSMTQQENYKVRDVVSILYKEGLILTRDFSFDSAEYKIGNDEPLVYRINNENQYLLIYPYDSIQEREKADDNHDYIKFREGFPQEYGIGFTAKNIILIYVAKSFSFTAENSEIRANLKVLSKTIFFELNKGTEVLYRGESEHWEAGLLVTYYENWWKDEQGTLRHESFSNTHGTLRYKGNPDEVGKYEVRFEHPGGALSRASDRFRQENFEIRSSEVYGGVQMFWGHLGPHGGSIPKTGTFKATIEWKDNLKEVIELKP